MMGYRVQGHWASLRRKGALLLALLVAPVAGAALPGGPITVGTADAQAQIESNQGLAALARGGVSRAGDVNGDGYDDVIVGATNYDTGETIRGAAFVFLGGPSGITGTNPGNAHAQIYPAGTVSGAGDVNGDGYDDVIVGVANFEAGEMGEGAAFVFHGGPSGITGTGPSDADAMIQGNQAYSGLGGAVASAGDVNSDMYDDLVVGAPNYNAGVDGEGAMFVFHGGASGITGTDPSTADADIRGTVFMGSFGLSLSGAGDVNGDGYDDVIVAHPDADEAGGSAALVFLGGPTGITGTDPSTADNLIQTSGVPVSGAGDVNGDGYDDVIVATSSYNDLFTAGAAVFLGGPSGISGDDLTMAHAYIQCHQRDAGMGSSLSGAGDVNGDGYDDVIVGAYWWDGGNQNEGAAFVFLFPVFVGTELTAADYVGNNNGILEPGETVEVRPSWSASSAAADVSATGLPPSGGYSFLDNAAAYGDLAPNTPVSCTASNDCYELLFDDTRRASHWDAILRETLSTSLGNRVRSWRLHVGSSFDDVPPTSPFYPWVEDLFHNGVTAGCSETEYCPQEVTTRAQMAVFVMKAVSGVGYVRQPCSDQAFADVPASSPYCPWIRDLRNWGVTEGCGPGIYCPDQPIDRAQMAVFVLKALDPQLTPPACSTPMFNDVPAGWHFCPWIEELARRGVVVGCGGGNYCPGSPVTREQMGVFIGKTFDLQIYGPSPPQ